MTNPTGYTHRAAFPDGQHPDTDRSIFHDDRCIARIQKLHFGPSQSQWEWDIHWEGAKMPKSGRAASMEDALELIRRRHIADGQPGYVKTARFG